MSIPDLFLISTMMCVSISMKKLRLLFHFLRKGKLYFFLVQIL